MRRSGRRWQLRTHCGALLAVSLAMVSACSQGEPARPGLGDVGGSPDGVAGGPTSRCDANATVSAAAVKTCLTERPAEQGTCLELVFHQYLESQPTASALTFLQCLEDSDDTIRTACHPVAHAIGRETFAVKGTVDTAFQACNQTCHSGCYHGVMERFLRGDAPPGGHVTLGELEAKVATACSPTLPFVLRFQCLHGLGHAITYYAEYDLKLSLKLCDATGDDWSSASCWGGVFMENLASATPEKRDVSPTDYHHPCDTVDEKYKTVCYQMQSSRMTEMGLSPAQIFVECRNAGSYGITCVESLGRDLSNLARQGDPRGVSATCELGVGEQVQACTRGVVHALIDNTWDGRYALAYCTTYATAESVAYCYADAIGWLEVVYNRAPDELAQECAQYAPGVQACLTALGR